MGFEEAHHFVGVCVEQSATTGVDEDGPDDGEELEKAGVAGGDFDPDGAFADSRFAINIWLCG